MALRTHDSSPGHTDIRNISIVVGKRCKEVRYEAILRPQGSRGGPILEEVGVVREVLWSVGSVDHPELLAGRLEAHPALVIYTGARNGARRTLEAFGLRVEVPLLEGSRSARVLCCPPALVRKVPFFEADLGSLPLADLLVPDVRDAEERHHVITMGEFPPQDSVSVP